MAQQVTLQPPHDEKASMEYRRGGRFRISLGVGAGILLAIAVLFFVIWMLGRLLG